jgi:hypothetical protein
MKSTIFRGSHPGQAPSRNCHTFTLFSLLGADLGRHFLRQAWLPCLAVQKLHKINYANWAHQEILEDPPLDSGYPLNLFMIRVVFRLERALLRHNESLRAVALGACAFQT